MTDFIRGLIYGSLHLALSAWFVMIAEGALADDFGWPTLGYTQAVLLVWGVGSLIGYGVSGVVYRLTFGSDE